MIKHIKQGDRIGVAKQVQGAVVDVKSHLRFTGMYTFTYNGEPWTCSDYAFDEEYKSEMD